MKKEVKRYTLCSKSIFIMTFDSTEEKQEFIDNKLDKINNDKKSQYFLMVSKKDRKASNKLDLVKFLKLEDNSTLDYIDERTFETYKKNLLFNNDDRLVIVYKAKGRIRTLDLAPKDSEKYFDEKFLSDRIFELITSGNLRVTEISCLKCISEARDLEMIIEKMAKIQGDYEEAKTAGLYGMNGTVINFVKSLNIREHYRRFRDVALFIYEKDLKQMQKENHTSQVKSRDIKPIEERSIEVIGNYLQTTMFDEDTSMVYRSKN